jgi:hypothetical protein
MAIYYFVTLAHKSVLDIVTIGDPLWCGRIACLTCSSMIVLEWWRSCKETLELEFPFVVFAVWKVNDFWILANKLIHCWRNCLEASWHIFSCYIPRAWPHYYFPYFSCIFGDAKWTFEVPLAPPRWNVIWWPWFSVTDQVDAYLCWLHVGSTLEMNFAANLITRYITCNRWNESLQLSRSS